MILKDMTKPFRLKDIHKILYCKGQSQSEDQTYAVLLLFVHQGFLVTQEFNGETWYKRTNKPIPPIDE